MSAAGQIRADSEMRARSGVRESPAGSWLAFCALALYGTLRWGTMLAGGEQGRLFASLLVAVFAAAALRRLPGGARIAGDGGWALLSVMVLGALALIVIAGFTLSWHLVALARQIGDGVSALPGVLVPYDGADPATAAALVLGGALLMFCGAVMFGSGRRAPGTLRLALAALPLLVLAAVPSMIVSPRIPYFHALVTFVLVALLVFSSRVAPGRLQGAAVLVAVAGLAGAAGVVAIAGPKPWVQVATGHAVGGTGSSAGATTVEERFSWQQTYGIQGWPYSGATVLRVSAPRPAYWKTEDLDVFDGTGWTANPGSENVGLQGVSAATVRTYSEELSVSLGQMSSPEVIAAGYAQAPALIGAVPGNDPGTWEVSPPLNPGENYQVRVYVPDPPAMQLAGAGTGYPSEVKPFRRLRLPSGVYSGVEALSRRLARGTDSPYSYVESVLAYLQHGYVYTLDPPSGGEYPLVSFLLHSRRGYCQQFAGAMALLLRMKGVPARVAVGFSTGTHKAGSATYLVADRDAHAWVEVWFPGFGWVAFDPTPGPASVGGSGPAAGSSAKSAPPPGEASPAGTPAERTAHAGTPADRSARTNDRSSGHSAPTAGAQTRSGVPLGVIGATILVVLALAALVGLAGLVRRLRRPPSSEALTAELERAFDRCGQRLDDRITLAMLSRRVSASPAAAHYITALADARYGSGAGAPTAAGRAALRRWLAQGQGLGGWLRALRALPPQRRPLGA